MSSLAGPLKCALFAEVGMSVMRLAIKADKFEPCSAKKYGKHGLVIR